MSKIGYGLNLSLPSQQKKKQQQQQQSTKLPHPPAFRFNDDDEDDVESDISRQASKNKYLKDTEEQQKKALKEDPTVFDYDGVYDDMKLKAIQPQVQDHQDRMDHEWRQAVTAAGSGCVAALSVERYLVSKDLLIEFHQPQTEEVKKELTDRDVQAGFDITLTKHKGKYALRKLSHESPRLICVLYTAPTCGPC